MVNYMPKVSIIMNCFNGEKYLREALDSIYAQTFSDWEIIFFDNNSSDNSSTIAQSYDSRLKYHLNSETIPLGHARHEAVKMATGEWIAFLDVDDSWNSNNLESQISQLEDSEYILSYAGVREITESGKIIRDCLPLHSSGNIFPDLLLQFDINMVTPLIRREFMIENNLNFEPIITASEEYNLFMRIAAKGKVLSIPEILGNYRVSSSSLTNKQISKWATERRITLEQLATENPEKFVTYANEFKLAYDRSDYYEASYLMSLGQKRKARKLLLGIKNGLIYQLLGILTYSTILWKLFHSSFIKRNLVRLMGYVK